MVTLLSKTADTNIFIRDEAVKALEAMTENVPPQKSLAVLISTGTGYEHDLTYSCDQQLVAVCGLWAVMPNWDAGGRASAGGLGAKPHRRWSINAFCVMVKPFS